MTRLGLALLVAGAPAMAQVICDDFEDGILDPRYTPLGGAEVFEADGFMHVDMPETGDGVFIDIGDEVPEARCFMGSFFVSNAEPDAGLEFSVQYDDLDTPEGAYTLVSVVVAPDPLGAGQVKFTAEAFDAEGNSIIQRDGTFEDCKFEGEWEYQLDFVNGKWVFDWSIKGDVEEDDCIVKAILDHPDLGDAYTKYLTNTLKAKSVKVESRSDPLVLFDLMKFDSEHAFDCYADFNVDGEANIRDFIEFQVAWQAQDPTADCQEDGLFDILDFVCFQAQFAKGCE